MNGTTHPWCGDGPKPPLKVNACLITKSADATQKRQPQLPQPTQHDELSIPAAERISTDALLSQKAAAAVLTVSERCLEQWRKNGGGPPYIRIGPRRIAFRYGDLIAWTNKKKYAHRAEELSGIVKDGRRG